MAEPKQIKVISVPNSLDARQRSIVGEEIVRFIQQRTRKGLDINNNPFGKYSDSYKDSLDFKIAGKTNRVNLELTGEMLNTLEVIKSSPGFITIGFPDEDSNNKAFYASQHGYKFLDINKKDLNSILSNFTSGSEAQNVSVSSSIASNFLRGLLRGG